jgi:hypothetical protein
MAMESSVNNRLLGSYDPYNQGFSHKKKKGIVVEKDWDDFVDFLGAGVAYIFGFIILIVVLNIFGSCLGCDTCVDICNSCSCGSQKCGTMLEKNGCGKNSSSSSDKTTSASCSCMGCTCFTCSSGSGTTTETPTQTGCQSSSSSSGCSKSSSSSSKGCSSTPDTTYITFTVHYIDQNGKELALITYGDVKNLLKAGKTISLRDFDLSNYYELDGFYDSKDCTTTYVNSDRKIKKTITNNMTLYARFNEIGLGEPVTVHFNTPEGMEQIQDGIFNIGQPIVSLPIPTSGTQQFNGWMFSNGTQITTGNSTTPISNFQIFHLYSYGLSSGEDLTLEASYGENRPTVQFVINNKVVYEDDVTYGSNASELIEYVPVSDSAKYKVVGWSVDPNSSENINLEDYKITQDTVFYAHCVDPHPITLWYQITGASDDKKVLQYYEGDTDVKLSLEALGLQNMVKRGYRFLGWFDKPDQSGDQYTEISEITKYTPSDLYAHWEEVEYTIKFYSDGIFVNQIKYKYGDNVSLFTENDVDAKYGYTFAGWTNDTYRNPIKTLPTDAYGDMILNAYYAPITVKLVLDPGSGDLSQTFANCKYGSTVHLPVPTRQNWTFDGWYYGDIRLTNSSGMFEAPLTFEYLSLTADETNQQMLINGIQLSAHYSRPTYAIIYYQDSRQPFKADQVEYQHSITNIPEAPAKTGYTFVCWSETAKIDNPFDFTAIITKDTNLYACYSANSYTVTFMVNDSVFRTINVTYDAEWSATSIIPTMENKDFAGWYDKDFKTKYIDKNGNFIGTYSPYNLTTNLVLYARFDDR